MKNQIFNSNGISSLPYTKRKHGKTSPGRQDVFSLQYWYKEHNWKARLVIFALALVVYSTNLDGNFVFDDAEAIVNNPDVNGRSKDFWTNVLRHDFWGRPIASNKSHKSFRPITTLTFRLNYQYSGTNTESYHAVNIVLHGIVCLFVHEVLELILEQSFGNHKPAEAFLASILFTLHPIHTECVSNIVGRAELLSAIFFLAAFICYCKGLRNDGDFCCLVLTSVLSGLSMLSKEQGITVLGVCLVYDALIGSGIRWAKLIELYHDYGNNNYDPHKSSHFTDRVSAFFKRALIISIVGLALIIGRLAAMNWSSPPFSPPDNPASFHPNLHIRVSITPVINYIYIYCINLWLLVNPSDLCFDYSMGCIPLITKPFADYRTIFVLAFIAAVGFIAHSILCRLSIQLKKLTMMSITFLIIPFLPSSNVPFRVGFVVAERVLYLPSIGFCLISAYALLNIPSTTTSRQLRTYLIPVILLSFGAKTLRRTAEWRSEYEIFHAGAFICPNNAKVHYNLAKVLSDGGHHDLALHKYQTALRLYPRYDQAMNNLANLLKEDGRLLDAERLLQSAVQIRPDFAAAWMNLGIVKTGLKKFTEAEKVYGKALIFRPEYPDCYFNLGNLYLEWEGRQWEALRAWRNATIQKPTHAKAWMNMIIFLDGEDECSEAVKFGEEALQHVPRDPGIHFSHGSCLGKLGQNQPAEHHILTAIQMSPQNPSYYANLGVLYHRWKRYEEAELMYSKALQLNPDLPILNKNVKMLKRELGKSSKTKS